MKRAAYQARDGRRGRAMVLLSVILVITIAALAGTTAMYLAQAQMAGTRTTLKRTQGRSLAWSGVQAVMAQMADQREKLLDGGAPELTAEWELFVDEGRGRGVVRLVAWGEDGPLVESEAGKLDLNAASVEMLKAAGLDEKSAGAIVSARGSHPFLSERDVLRVQGVSLGAVALGRGSAAPSGFRDESVMPDPAASFLRQCTVFVFDPNVQSGLGTNGSDHRGKQRVNLNTPWSDRLGAAVDERFGEGASQALKALFDGGTKFKTLADVVKATRTVITDAKAWPPVFDALTVTEDPYVLGRVDLNRAPAEILACVPGISADAAAKIVETRDALDAESRRTIVWPVAQGILKQDEFEKAADHLTTRSMQWRVRVEAGIGAAEEGSDGAALTDRVVLEAVIDVASERPRVAYLRDVTIEDVVERIAAAQRKDVETEPDGAATEPEPVVPSAASGGRDLKLDTDLDLSSKMDKGFGDLNLNGPPEKPAADGAAGATGSGPTVAPPTTPPSDGVDRRVGRWTTGKSGKGVPS